ncbi:MAG: hypothetical protein A2075_23370 [Geobacteraceae bacterium GWC2_58_44]|nr:MAG: hypothetical protein A2075_23370 [Geobacteraceae bacterium GWC2_58_44]
MKTLSQIDLAVKTIRQHQETAQRQASALEGELMKVNDGTRSAEYVTQQTSVLREKFVPAVREALAAVTGIVGELSASQAAWQSKAFVLSQRALTSTGSGNLYGPAADPALEAMSRISTMMELAKMPTDMVHQVADTAKGNPQKHGLLHLAILENSSRDTSSSNWSPISLDDVELPDRTQALALITEANGAQASLENVWKTAIGSRVNPADRIAAARAGGAK